MKDDERLQKLFLRQSTQRRIAEIGSNLANIYSLEPNANMAEFVSNLIDQSRKFIAWTIQDVSQRNLAQLSSLDEELSRWQENILRRWLEDGERKNFCRTAHEWSERLTEMSGLLHEVPNDSRKVAEPKP